MATTLVPDLLPLARRLVELCGVQPGETVIVFCDDGTVPAWAAAFHAAATDRGCDATVYRCAARQGLIVDFPPRAIEALLQADIVFDLSTSVWAYTDTHGRLTGPDQSVRVAYVGGNAKSIETIRLIPPDPELAVRIRRARDLVDGVETFRITSSLGTDLILRRGDREQFPVLMQGIPVTEPGQFGDLFGGWVAMALPEAGVDGVVQYVGAYDAIGGPYHRVVDEPIALHIEGGRITRIGGDHEEARALAQWFRSWRDPNSYRFSHFNVGLDHRARHYRFPDTNLHAAHGGMILAFGSNYSPGIFGRGSIVRARSHVDLTLMGASLAIDGRQILVDGEFTPDSGLRGPHVQGGGAA